MNWYVLLSSINKTEQLIINFNKKGDIEVFTPQYENYHRSSKSYDIKPVFKEYIFVKSKLS